MMQRCFPQGCMPPGDVRAHSLSEVVSLHCAEASGRWSWEGRAKELKALAPHSIKVWAHTQGGELVSRGLLALQSAECRLLPL